MICNPAAGRGLARRHAPRVARAFRAQGWTVEVAETEGPRHATRLATAAAARGVERVIALGGDGTVHEVANGLLQAGSRALFAVIPVGSGNDFAKLTGMHPHRHDVERAVAKIVTATPRRFDAGRVFDEYFVNSMGFGFGPAVVRTRNAMPSLRGFLSYLIPVLRSFATYRPVRLDVRAAEHRETGNLMMLEVCNGTTAGGDYRFAPEADPGDGRLDVCLIRAVSLPRFLLAIPRVMRGTHGAMREVASFRTRSLTIRGEAPLLLHLDGELRAPGATECTVTVEPKCLNVLVAK